MRRLTVYQATARLEELLPVHAPELWESLLPSATAECIEALSEAVAPRDVPPDLIEFLCWRNGGPWGGPWWPVVDCGHLLGTNEAVDHYQWLCENTEDWQWHRSWLPIAHEGWYQCGIELGDVHGGVIIDGSFPDPPRPVAPSLVAVLHATVAVIEAGLQDETPSQTADATYVRVAQKALIDPIYEIYGPMPSDVAAP